MITSNHLADRYPTAPKSCAHKLLERVDVDARRKTQLDFAGYKVVVAGYGRVSIFSSRLIWRSPLLLQETWLSTWDESREFTRSHFTYDMQKTRMAEVNRKNRIWVWVWPHNKLVSIVLVQSIVEQRDHIILLRANNLARHGRLGEVRLERWTYWRAKANPK